MLDSVIRRLILLGSIWAWVSITQDDPLGCKQLLKLAILLHGEQGQDLGDIWSLSCHGIDRLTED